MMFYQSMATIGTVIGLIGLIAFGSGFDGNPDTWVWNSDYRDAW